MTLSEPKPTSERPLGFAMLAASTNLQRTTTMNATQIFELIGWLLEPAIQADIVKLYAELKADLAGGNITAEQAVDRVAEMNTQILADRKTEDADMAAKDKTFPTGGA